MWLLGWRNWKATCLKLGTWIKLRLVNTHCTKPVPNLFGSGDEYLDCKAWAQSSATEMTQLTLLLKLQQDLNFHVSQPLQRNILQKLLVNAWNHENSRLSFHPAWSVLSLNNNISFYLMNCQPSPEGDTLMSGESCPVLIYLSQEHRSDNDFFSSPCWSRVSVRPLPDPDKGNLHKKGGTDWMVTEFQPSQAGNFSFLPKQAGCQLRGAERKKKVEELKRNERVETRAWTPTQISGKSS